MGSTVYKLRRRTIGSAYGRQSTRYFSGMPREVMVSLRNNFACDFVVEEMPMEGKKIDSICARLSALTPIQFNVTQNDATENAFTMNFGITRKKEFMSTW